MFGHKIGGAGAAMTLMFFFAPWVLFSCGNTPIGEFSGYELASGQVFTDISQAQQFNLSDNTFAVLWLIPLISLFLLFIVSMALSRQSTFFTPQVDGALFIGSAILQMLVIYNRLSTTRQASMNATDAAIMGSIVQVDWQYGLFMTVIGLILMIASGYIIIRNNQY